MLGLCGLEWEVAQKIYKHGVNMSMSWSHYAFNDWC